MASNLFASFVDVDPFKFINSTSEIDREGSFPVNILGSILEFCTEPRQFFIVYLMSQEFSFTIDSHPRWTRHIRFYLYDVKKLPKTVQKYVTNLTIHETLRPKFNNSQMKKVGKLFPNLRILNVNECPQINDKIVKCLENVVDFHICQCKKVTNKVFEQLRNFLPFLKKLSISDNPRINDTGFEYIPEYLTHLDVSRNEKITDVAFTKINPLISLNVSGCKGLTKECLKSFNGVKDLNISDCIGINIENDDDKCLDSIRGGIATLNAGGLHCHIMNDGGLEMISGSLVSLDISYNSLVTDLGLQYLQTHRMKYLNLSSCTEITDEGLFHLKDFQGELYLQDNQKITDAGVKHISPNLCHTVDLSFCSQITNEGVQHFCKTYRLIVRGNRKITNRCIKSLTHVEVLNLSDCPKISDKGMSYISDSVRSINISKCTKITDEGLRFLELCDDLNISFLPNITDSGLKFLDRSLEVNIINCPKITDHGVHHLKYCEKLFLGGTTTHSSCNRRRPFARGLSSLKFIVEIHVAGEVKKVIDLEIYKFLKMRGIKFVYNAKEE